MRLTPFVKNATLILFPLWILLSVLYYNVFWYSHVQDDKWSIQYVYIYNLHLLMFAMVCIVQNWLIEDQCESKVTNSKIAI